jgi:hypothetical protein
VPGGGDDEFHFLFLDMLCKAVCNITKQPATQKEISALILFKED